MATLKTLVNETTNIKNELVECRDNLKQILIDKKMEGLDGNDNLSTLINKVDDFDEFIPPILYLYKNGDECMDVTGGWVFGGSVGSSNLSSGSYVREKRSDCIYMKTNSTGSAHYEANCKIENYMNFKNYNTLCIDCNIGHTTEVSKDFIRIWDNSGDNLVAKYTLGPNKILDRQILRVDLSLLGSGSIYICSPTQKNGKWAEMIMYNCWLER